MIDNFFQLSRAHVNDTNETTEQHVIRRTYSVPFPEGEKRDTTTPHAHCFK